MPMSLKGRSLLTLKDFSSEEIRYLLQLSLDLKAKKRAGIRGDLLAGRNIVLLFDKPSTRTRCAFEVAVYDEGGQVTFLTNSQMGKKESLEDTAIVLGRFYDGIEYRGSGQQIVRDLAKFSGVPVWNGLTDDYHPTQLLADIMTLMENITKPLNQAKLAFVGDARNNVANSLLIGCAKLGLDFAAVAPQSLFPDEKLVEEMTEVCRETGGTILLTEDIGEGVLGADAIYTDVWVSMGEESQFAERIALLKKYQVNMDLIRQTKNPETIFLHCLPSFHDRNTEIGEMIYQQYGLAEMEVTDEVFRSRHSKVFDEAENRMHTIKAVMCATLAL
ncbi:MAG: ornithine carbamoyltransferase [Clostridiales bacterium]|nr:ornithine carbamoyltransferase [Clostridiales bacterium]